MTGRLLLVAVLILVILATVQPAQATEPRRMKATITFYRWTGDPTTSGLWPTEGMAACSTDLRLGQWVTLDGRNLVCTDRGPGLYPTHVDVFCATHTCERWVTDLWPETTVEVWE